MTTRTCGTCHECCIHTPVAAFDKPADTPCIHLNVIQDCGACGIYEDRPSECRQYKCSWLEGKLADDCKPDASGLLFETAWIEREDGSTFTVIAGYENRAGAIAKHRAQLEAAAHDGTIIVAIMLDRVGSELLGDPHDLYWWAAFMEDCRRRGGVVHQYADGVVVEEF